MPRWLQPASAWSCPTTPSSCWYLHTWLPIILNVLIKGRFVANIRNIFFYYLTKSLYCFVFFKFFCCYIFNLSFEKLQFFIYFIIIKRVRFRFFVKTHGKQRKSAMSMKAKDKYNSKLTGPKPFPLERLLAIFYNIVEVI